MPDTGAPWNLRYPTIGDPANVPERMGQLAADVADGLDAIQEFAGEISDGLAAVVTALGGMKIVVGFVSITPAGVGTNTAGSAVTFPAGLFTGSPRIFTVVQSAVTDGASHYGFAWPTGISDTGFTPNVKRSVTSATTVNYLAIGA